MFDDAVANTVALAILCDITIAALVFWSWAMEEGPRLGIRRWWLIFPATLLIGLCFAFPLFMYWRERALPARLPPRPRPLALREQVPVVAAVEEEGMALARLGLDRVAGEDHVVAALDHVAELAGDPDEGVIEAR